MKKIIFPLKSDMKNKAVGDLHLALKSLGYKVSEREIIVKTFGISTRQEVAKFQKDCGLRPTGEVDKTTAECIKRKVG